MNNQCPSCSYNYSARRIPKNLKNCSHIICEKCLISTEKCPIDGEKIELKKHGMKSFTTNQQVLDDTKISTTDLKCVLNQKKDVNQIPSKLSINQITNNEKSEVKNDNNRQIEADSKSKENNSENSIGLQSKQSLESQNQLVKNVKTTKKIPESPILKQNNETAAYSSKKLNKKQRQQCKLEIKSSIKSPCKQKKCKIHQKNADVICLQDGQMICASCALFGDHKGHTVEDTKNFVVRLGELTEGTLQLQKQIKEKQYLLNNQVVRNLIEIELGNKRAQQLKLIKQFCTKMITAIKSAQKSMIERFDSYLIEKKEKILTQINLQDLENRTHEWYGEVQSLSQVMESVFRMQQLSRGLRFLDQTSEESYIQKKGEYLKLQYTSSENVFKSQIQDEVKDCQIYLDHSILERIEAFCQIGKQGTSFDHQMIGEAGLSVQNKSDSGINRQKSSINFSTPNSNTQSLKQRSNERQTTVQPTVVQQDEDLLDNNDFEVQHERTHHTILSLQQFDMDISEVKNDKENFLASVSSIHGQSYRVIDQLSQHPVKSLIKFSTTDRNKSVLKSTNDNKKRKSTDLSDKFLSIIEELKKDKLEIVDFTNAELGDNNLIMLCEHISKSSKVKVLKLNRNKLTDQCLEFLVSSCNNTKITTINLSNNVFTEQSIDYLFKLNSNGSKSQIRHVSLNFNKISRKIVKKKIEELSKINVMVTI